MTVAVNDTIERYLIAGAGPYAYTWRIFNDTDLQVYALSLAVPPVPTLLTYLTHYTVTGANDAGGGSITLTAAAIAAFTSFTLDIRSNTPRNQPTSIRNQARFLPEIHEDAFDYLDRQIQDMGRRVDASIQTPDNEPALPMILPPVAGRAGKFNAFDVLGLPIASSGTGNDSALRVDLATTTLAAEGDRLIGHRHPGTGSVAMSVYAVLRGMTLVSMFGAVGDAVTNDRAAVQAAIDWVSSQGGGTVAFEYGKTYRLTAGGSTTLGLSACALIKAGVTLDLCGATLSCEVSAINQCPVWMFGNGTWIKNGTVNGVYSGAPSAQSFFGSAISVGVPNNAGDSAAVPSAGQFMRGWGIEGCTLSTNRTRYPAVSVMGGANAGRIIRNHIPDSATASGFHFDWGNTGTVSSADIPTTRTSFNGGTAYTTHPHNIDLIGNSIGTLSVATLGDAGAFAVRVSGCYNIRVDGMEVESVANTGYFHTGGDLGFEFARPEDKRHAYQGMVCRRMSVRNFGAAAAQGVYVDTLGDNVYREQFISNYVPLANPLWHGDVFIEDCDFPGANQDNTYAARFIQARGVRIARTNLTRWKHGVLVDEMTRDITIDDNLITGNREDGVQVGVQQLREGTYNIKVTNNRIYGNGTTATAHGIDVARCFSLWCYGNILGQESGETQQFGIRVEDVAGAFRDLRFRDNHVNGGLGAYSLATSSPSDVLKYRIITEFENNTSSFGVTTLQGGQQFVPDHARLVGNSRQANWKLPTGSTSAPADGVWYKGDVIELSAPVPSGGPAYCCTTSGNFRALPAITNGSTTTGLPTFTCSITGITVNTTAQSYQVVVSSATGLFAGMKCSIAAAGITDALILSVSGTTLQLDTQATSTQVATAFSTTGLIEGEVVSINTTTPIAGATILKIAGTTVTLDINASDTQAGRTITSTAPVFKAQAAIAA
jgi:hypothetical protein